MPHPVTLGKAATGAALIRLARDRSIEGAALYAKIMSSWGHRLDRKFMTIKLSPEELEVFDSLGLPPTLVEYPRWVAVYRDPDDPRREVTVRSQAKPPKKRTFRLSGGRTRLTRVQLNNAFAQGDTADMATKTVKRSSRKKKDPEVDELEGLEELEALDDLDDLEGEEPEVEDDDEVEEKPKRSRSKKNTAKKTVSKRKKAEPEPDEEDDEEDLSGLTLKQLRAKAREAGVTGAGKMDKETLIGAIDAAEQEDDEEEAEEEELPKKTRSKKSTASKKTATKATKKEQPNQLTRELPKGKLGPNDIAELAGVTGRDVRQYLRKNGVEKDEELGRYAFTKKQVEQIAKKIKATNK